MTVYRHYPSVDSTNTQAHRVLDTLPAHEENTLVAVVSADVQTAGRGRLGRHWVSNEEKNLYASYVCSISRGLYGTQGSWLPTVAGLAALDALKDYSSAPVRLKWPNDLYLDEKKLGGILCDVVAKPDEIFVIMGIGINLASAPDSSQTDGLYTPTSLYISEDVTGELRGKIGQKIADALAHWNADELRARAKAESATLGRRVHVQLADGTIRSGTATDITRAARLEIDGAWEVSVGDVLHAHIQTNTDSDDDSRRNA